MTVYSFGYLRPMEATRNLGAMGFFYNLLLLSLALVFTAANAFFFLTGLGTDGHRCVLPGHLRA